MWETKWTVERRHSGSVVSAPLEVSPQARKHGFESRLWGRLRGFQERMGPSSKSGLSTRLRRSRALAILF